MAVLRPSCLGGTASRRVVYALLLLLISSTVSVEGFQFQLATDNFLRSRFRPPSVSFRRRTKAASSCRLFRSRISPKSSSTDNNNLLSDLPLDDAEQDESQQMGAWVPVGSVSCFDGQPLKLELLGQTFVVWKAAHGNWSVLRDECPHRQAPLSLGRVEGNCIECPFHGWQFDAAGTLQRIPQLESDGSLQASSRSVQSFPTHLTGDLLWVFLPTSLHAESFPRTLLPEQYYHDLCSFVDANATFYSQELPFSYDFLVENGLDGPVHSYFAHHKLGFDRSEAGPIPIALPVSNFTELVTEVEYRRQGSMRLRRYGFQRPFLVSNQQPAAGGGWKTAIIFFAVPVREGCSRLITTFDTLSPHPWTPDWLLHWINRKFLEGDMFVHSQEITIRKSPEANPKYIHATSSDTACRAWRAWWTKYGLSAAPRNTFGPASSENLRPLEVHELADPWRAHTRHCSKCKKALQRLKLIRVASWAVIWSALALYRRNAFGSFALALLGAAASWGTGKMITELQGAPNKSEVGDRSLSASLS